jgi:zinc/manganese transport system substrate-binding protein
MKRHAVLAAAVFAAALTAEANVRVVTSTSDLEDFVRKVGGEKVTVTSIVAGDRNPHYVEVKPSYMMKLKSAEIFFIVGLDLELWAPQLVDGSRNDALTIVDLSKGIRKLEVPTRTPDASEGDVHRFGNPHYWLDPRNVPAIADEIVDALSRVSPGDEQYFRSNAERYCREVRTRTAEWEKQLKPFAGSKVLSFHRSWTYFAEWAGIVVAGQVEPKPGVPPSPSHTAEMVTLARSAGIKAIIVEPFYDAGAAEQIARSSGAQVLRLPASVGGNGEAKDYLSMMEYNVRTLTGALR